MTAPDPALMRVMLFTPANRPERFGKAAATGADGLILDLEDAVSNAEKDKARETLIAHFSGDFRSILRPQQLCGLRVNNIHTAHGLKDLCAIVATGIAPDFILLPKVESAFEVQLYARQLCGAQSRIALLCAIESASGIEAAFDIASSHPRVRMLGFGGVDLALDLRASFAWEPLLAARSRIVQAAASSGIGVADVPYLALSDETGLAAETERIKSLGFTAKFAIHPKQVEIIQRIFTPNAAEVARANAMIAAFRAGNGNAVEFEGKMLEEPIVRMAQQILSRAR